MRESGWPNINTLWAEVLVDELARCGLRTVVISPGSRSTPLVMAFAAHPDIEDLSIIDERSAAFFALGVARATRRPTAILCTSGTAAANYFPAICEANADDVPLVALTADRPVDRLESGASQAMNQTKLYGEHARWFHDLGLPELDARRLRALRSTMGLAWRHATTPLDGPVHVNVPFRKPLEPLPVDDDHRAAVPEPLPEAIATAVAGRTDGGAWAPFARPTQTPDAETVERFVDEILEAERPLFLVGADLDGTTYAGVLDRFASRVGAPVLAEPTSGIRFDGAGHEAVIGAGDLLLRVDLHEEIGQPDLIVQFGKPPLHWAARGLMRDTQSARRIVVTPSGRRLDPEHRPTWFLESDACELLEHADARAHELHAFETRREWFEVHRAAASTSVRALARSMGEEDELHEARVWRELGRELPEDAAVFVSNSMPVRHFDTFLQGRTQPLAAFFNRGLNGIDGILSTGLGVAHARTVPTSDGGGRSGTVIVTGDVAFRHDIGALLAGRRLDVDATIVVCDNGGGGIFAALPIVEFEDTFEEHFLTPPGLDSTDAMLGVRVAEPTSRDGFRARLSESLSSRGLHIIRVRTDREQDVALADKHLERVEAAVDEAIRGKSVRANRYTTLKAEAAPPLVCLHGFSGSADDWRQHERELGRSCIALDLPGHTAMPRLEAVGGRGLRSAVAWLERTLSRRGCDVVHLAGYSMGGRIALAYTLEHPGRVASLSLIGAHPGIRDAEARSERADWDEQMAATLQRDGLHAFVDQWMRHPVLEDQLGLAHGRVVDARNGRLQHTSAGLAAAFRSFGTGSQRPMWDQLADLETPTLFLAGEYDEKYVRVGDEFSEYAPNASFSVIDGAGHNVLLEKPEAAIAAIRAHIERAESS